MPENNNENKIKNSISLDRSTDSLDKGSIGNSLNSDNAFNDSGLENISKLKKAVKRGNTE